MARTSGGRMLEGVSYGVQERHRNPLGTSPARSHFVLQDIL
jgi:hypothetical protein